MNNTPTTTNMHRHYIVSETTAAIFDCITAAADLYNKMWDMLAGRYPAMREDDKAEQEHLAPYLEVFLQLDDLLYKEVTTAVVDALGVDTANAHSETPTL